MWFLPIRESRVDEAVGGGTVGVCVEGRGHSSCLLCESALICALSPWPPERCPPNVP